MEFTAIAPAANPSKLWRALAAMTLAAAWAANPAHAAECDPGSGGDPGQSVVNPGDPTGEGECRVDVSGPLGETPPNFAYASSSLLTGAAPTIYVDVCGSWPEGVANSEITFAELEYLSDARNQPSTVVALTAALVNGIPLLVVDVVDAVPRGWSLTNPTNQLPLTPRATIPISDCKDDLAAPFLGSTIEIKLVNNKIKIDRYGQNLMTWPSPMESPRWRPELYPGVLRVNQLRNENAIGSTARTLWSYGFD